MSAIDDGEAMLALRHHAHVGKVIRHPQRRRTYSRRLNRLPLLHHLLHLLQPVVFESRMSRVHNKRFLRRMNLPAFRAIFNVLRNVADSKRLIDRDLLMNLDLIVFAGVARLLAIDEQVAEQNENIFDILLATDLGQFALFDKIARGRHQIDVGGETRSNIAHLLPLIKRLHVLIDASVDRRDLHHRQLQILVVGMQWQCVLGQLPQQQRVLGDALQRLDEIRLDVETVAFRIKLCGVDKCFKFATANIEFGDETGSLLVTVQIRLIHVEEGRKLQKLVGDLGGGRVPFFVESLEGRQKICVERDKRWDVVEQQTMLLWIQNRHLFARCQWHNVHFGQHLEITHICTFGLDKLLYGSVA
mmetsp:Transcript_16818/g.26106  ORF Transcript_16818/g.26106 Transcript_16818/m.26106 type:complete len:359 (-) Transcript_16818:98-1174(-)